MRDFLATPFIAVGWVIGFVFGLVGYEPKWLKRRKEKRADS